MFAPRQLMAAVARSLAVERAVDRSFWWLLVAVVVAAALQDLVLAAWLGARLGPMVGLEMAVRFVSSAVGSLFVAYVAAWLMLLAFARASRRLYAAVLAQVVAFPLAISTVAHALTGWWWLPWAGIFWSFVLLSAAVVEVRRPPHEAELDETRWLATMSGISGWRRWIVGAGVAAALIAQGTALWTGRAAWAASHQYDAVLKLPVIAEDGGLIAQEHEHLANASPIARLRVVEIWATWCGPCRASLTHVGALSARHDDAAFVLVNIDDPVRAAALVAALPARSAQLRSVFDSQRYAERMGATSVPTFAVYGEAGQLIDLWSGMDSARLERHLASKM